MAVLLSILPSTYIVKYLYLYVVSMAVGGLVATLFLRPPASWTQVDLGKPFWRCTEAASLHVVVYGSEGVQGVLEVYVGA